MSTGINCYRKDMACKSGALVSRLRMHPASIGSNFSKHNILNSHDNGTAMDLACKNGGPSSLTYASPVSRIPVFSTAATSIKKPVGLHSLCCVSQVLYARGGFIQFTVVYRWRATA